MTYYVRGEFYQEKAKDYVRAAIVTGVSETGIMFRHILPNTHAGHFLCPIHARSQHQLPRRPRLPRLQPPAPTPGWGKLIGRGMENLTKWWLVLFPLGVLFVTLLLVVFIGEAVREAFDPKEYSRLR